MSAIRRLGAALLAAILVGSAAGWIHYIFFQQIVAGPLVPQAWPNGSFGFGRWVPWYERLSHLAMPLSWLGNLPMILPAILVAAAAACTYTGLEGARAGRRWAWAMLAASVVGSAYLAGFAPLTDASGESIADPTVADRELAFLAWLRSGAVLGDLIYWWLLTALAIGLVQAMSWRGRGSDKTNAGRDHAASSQ